MSDIHGLRSLGGGQVLCGLEVRFARATLDHASITCQACASVAERLVGRSGNQDGLAEQAFMGQVIRTARQSGWLCYHTFDSRKSPEGFPDLLVVHPDPEREWVYALELKTAQGKSTMAQQLWLAALDGKRITARVVRPADFADIVQLLRQR